MEDHEQSEVNRKPLQDVILNLRGVLEDSADFNGVVPILKNLLQPPEMSNVNKSFDHLFDSSMITAPTDEGRVTSIGKIAAHLPVDFSLGYLISIGISLNMGAEAVVMASALSQPKSIFLLSSRMSVPDEYNKGIKRTFVGSNFFDDGVYSEPIMMLRVFLSWQELARDERQSWLSKHNLHNQRLKQFVLMAHHLVDRVNRALRSGRTNLSRQQVDLTTMSSNLSPSDINKLRLMLTWSSAGGIIEMKPYKFIHPKQLCTVTVNCGENVLTKKHIEPLLPKNVKWSMKSSERVKFSAKLSSARENNTDMELLTVLAQSVAEESIPVISVMSKSGRNVTAFNVLIPLNSPKLRGEAELYLEFLKTVVVGSFQLEVTGEILGNPVFTIRKGPKDKSLPRKVATTGQNTQIIAHSLHMLICEGNGSAEVISTNCRPTSASLSDIFFGEGDVASIKEESLPTLYTLGFPEPVSKDSTGSLVTDVNIGMRILKSMAPSYGSDIKLMKNPKSKQSEMIKENPKNALQAGGGREGDTVHPLPSNLLGKAGPVNPKKKADKVDDNVMLAVIDMVPNSKWSCHPFCWSQNATLSLDKQVPARLPRQSLLNVAMPCDDHPLYGITQKVLVTVSGNNKHASCDGVTLLPPGKKWLQVALLCLDKYGDASQDLFGASSSLTSTDLEIASKCSEIIADIQSSPIQSNDALIDLVDCLFSRWCDGTAVVDDVDAEDDNVVDEDDDDNDDDDNVTSQRDHAVVDELVRLVQRRGNYRVNEVRAFLKIKSGGSNALLKRIKPLLLSDKRVEYHYDKIYDNGKVAWNSHCYFTAPTSDSSNNTNQSATRAPDPANKEKRLTRKEKAKKKDKNQVNQKIISFQKQERIRLEQEGAFVKLVISKILERGGHPYFVKEMEEFCKANGYKSQRKFMRIYSRIREDERVVYHPSSNNSASFIEGWFTPASIVATDSLLYDSINEITSRGEDALTVDDILNIIASDSFLYMEIIKEITTRGGSITVGEVLKICNASKTPGLIRKGLHARILDMLKSDRYLVYECSGVPAESKFTLEYNDDVEDDDEDDDDDEDNDDDDDDDGDDDDDDEVALKAGGGSH